MNKILNHPLPFFFSHWVTCLSAWKVESRLWLKNRQPLEKRSRPSFPRPFSTSVFSFTYNSESFSLLLLASGHCSRYYFCPRKASSRQRCKRILEHGGGSHHSSGRSSWGWTYGGWSLSCVIDDIFWHHSIAIVYHKLVQSSQITLWKKSIGQIRKWSSIVKKQKKTVDITFGNGHHK